MLRNGEATAALLGSWRLAHLDPSGMAYFDRSRDGFWHSFYAALIVLPGFYLLTLTRVPDAALDRSGLFTVLLVETIGYIANWAAFPLVMISLARWLDRDARYFDFMVAYNWSSVVQMAAYLLVTLVSVMGILPEAVADTLIFTVTLAVLYYEWFIARTALEIPGLPAATVVLIDLLIGVVISSISGSLY
jgi:hypothetical protein